MIDIYIGYDSKEVVAYHTLVQSIIDRASEPVRFCPIALGPLAGIFTRERNALQSTEFSFSRFLVPYLSEYKGWSLFMDCDMVMRADVAELWRLRDERYAVMCVKHDYTPSEETKFLGQVQTIYPKKNWSSVMMFNNEKCRALTVDYVNSASGLQLHQFKWLESEELIGSLPLEWNFLVGVYDPRPDARLVHFTEGGPYFSEYRDSDFAEDWFAAEDRARSVAKQ